MSSYVRINPIVELVKALRIVGVEIPMDDMPEVVGAVQAADVSEPRNGAGTPR